MLQRRALEPRSPLRTEGFPRLVALAILVVAVFGGIYVFVSNLTGTQTAAIEMTGLSAAVVAGLALAGVGIARSTA
jgi:hypothetical protein